MQSSSRRSSSCWRRCTGARQHRRRRTPDRGSTKRNTRKSTNSKGGEKYWKDFSFHFLVATKLADKPTENIMQLLMQTKDDMKVDQIVASDGFKYDPDETRTRATELYDILCLQTQGEALQIVKSITDMDGFAAWQKLYKAFNSMTHAKMMHKMMEVVSPPKVTDLREMNTKVEDWEAKERELKLETGETIPEKFRMAILTMMTPPSVQEWVLQTIADNTSYTVLRDKMLGIAKNKVAIHDGPVPMDISRVHQEHCQYQFEEWQKPQEREYEEGAVSLNTQCHTCWGYGHFARDCPTGKGGLGKGQYGGGKGGGKDGKGGKGKGQYDAGKGGKGDYGKGQYDGGKGKGKGKGIKGDCWKCGKPGHRAVDCRSVNSVDENDWNPEEQPAGEDGEKVEKGCGAVWMWAANVSKISKINPEPQAPKQKMKPVKKWIKVQNRYEPVAEEEIEENIVNNNCFKEMMKQKCIKESMEPPPGLRILRKVVNNVSMQKNNSKNNKSKKVNIEDPNKFNSVKMISENYPSPATQIVTKEINVVEKKPKLEEKKCAILFHVTRAKKMLISVERLAAAGNEVKFGPKSEDNVICNKTTGRTIQMEKRGGVYIVKVMIKVGHTWHEEEMTVDSGAEECVMPRDWYKEIELWEAKAGIKFMGADGSDMGNFGRRLIEFIPMAEFEGFPRRT